ncbi:MAG: hypothetical protein QXN59_00405 [Candidatus Micrarchaeaceae archaeon]
MRNIISFVSNFAIAISAISIAVAALSNSIFGDSDIALKKATSGLEASAAFLLLLVIIYNVVLLHV